MQYLGSTEITDGSGASSGASDGAVAPPGAEGSGGGGGGGGSVMATGVTGAGAGSGGVSGTHAARSPMIATAPTVARKRLPIGAIMAGPAQRLHWRPGRGGY